MRLTPLTSRAEGVHHDSRARGHPRRPDCSGSPAARLDQVDGEEGDRHGGLLRLARFWGLEGSGEQHPRVVPTVATRGILIF